MTQTIPFWTRFHCLLTEKRRTSRLVCWLWCLCRLQSWTKFLCWQENYSTGRLGDYFLNILYIAACINWCRTFHHFEEIHDVFWNCLFDFHSNFGEIFTWSGNLLSGCMIKGKTVMTWTNCMWKLLLVEMQVWSDYPPSEAALKQQSRRAFLQTQFWTASHVAKPHIQSPLEYGWQRGKDSLQTVYLEEPMSADILQDIVCSCKCKSPCKNHVFASS